MIKFYKKYPNAIIVIYSFNDEDYKYIKNIINSIIEYSSTYSKNITIYIDTYNLDEYSLYYVYKLIKFNNKFKYDNIKYISNIELYININKKNIISKFITFLQFMCPINISINFINKEKQWDKIFKEY